MLTGTDINISVCRSEGYPVVHHRTSLLNVDKQYRLTISNTECWTDSGTVKFNCLDRIYRVDSTFSYRELWNIFLSYGEHIKQFCDFKNCPYPDPNSNPQFIDFASIAGTIDSFVGLANW